MRRKGLSIFYVILSLFIVLLIGFMLLNFQNMKTDKVCTYEDQGQCCISIMDPCLGTSDSECYAGACNSNDCINECNNETYCTLFPSNATHPDEQHSCISEDCLGDVSKCSPVECALPAYKYDPSTRSGAGGRNWWLVLEVNEGITKCCQVTVDPSGARKKECGDDLKELFSP